MILTDDNYYGRQANMEYMSVSQFKSFRKCEEAALAELAGDYERDSSAALLSGSYLDSRFEGDESFARFKERSPQLFKRDGTLKSDYAHVEEIYQRLLKDKFFCKYLSGGKQVIMTGKIEAVPFKIKMDSYIPDKAIVDLKLMRDFSPVWDEEQHQKVPFTEAWGYDLQGAVYQEIVYQNTGKRLPFIIAAATKEAHPDHALLFVPQERLDDCLTLVKALAPRYQRLKTGVLEGAHRCGKCGWCRDTKHVTEIIDYRDYGKEI